MCVFVFAAQLQKLRPHSDTPKEDNPEHRDSQKQAVTSLKSPYGLFSKLWALLVMDHMAASIGIPKWDPSLGNYSI